FRRAVIDQIAEGGRLVALFGHSPAPGATRLMAVLAQAEASGLAVVATDVDGEYPAITPECPQAHLFEREIFEQWNVRPAGHPWLKPVRFPALRACGATEYFTMTGEDVHEVAVGPVHAGVIEPGHFRFQCHGETVYHLEISLGYQHRGAERAMLGGPGPRTIHYAETLAGDTTIGHATAYCQAVEAIRGTRVPARGQYLRGVALELERVANHIGDLGALAGDIGFLPTLSFCGRIRGDVLNMTAMLCGNRFGRGLVRPGGVALDVDADIVAGLCRRLTAAEKDTRSAVELLWSTPSVMARFDGVGVVTAETCEQIGLVGVAARACGVANDVRNAFPSGIYRFVHIPVSTWHTGDVFARAHVRWLEVQRSLAFIREQLNALPGGRATEPVGATAPLAAAGANRAVVTLVEGWRGEICHVAMTGDDGRFAAYKVVDPSFHNWFGLAMALRNQEISDFPLCNKSFNLSYCGHDL
ncbi:MAG: hydrogenase, partial [Patescibacteria group bacterium]|nr:hydrogenase [Patescibacteria group bacterium]